MKNTKDTPRSRMLLAMTLIAASFLSAFLLATFSHQGDDFWVASFDLPAGHHVVSGDFRLHHLVLESSAPLYLAKTDKPVGLVVVNTMVQGQILSLQNVSSSINRLAASAVPISIRAVDVAAGIALGDSVDIYWVIDSQNGESLIEPVLILGGVSLLSYDQKSKNFGTDAALTISVEETQVLRVLSATTHGRLVVIRSHV